MQKNSGSGGKCGLGERPLGWELAGLHSREALSCPGPALRHHPPPLQRGGVSELGRSPGPRRLAPVGLGHRRPGTPGSRPKQGLSCDFRRWDTLSLSFLSFPILILSLFLCSLFEIAKSSWTRRRAPRSASECRKDLKKKKVLNSSMIFLLERQLRIIISALLRAD